VKKIFKGDLTMKITNTVFAAFLLLTQVGTGSAESMIAYPDMTSAGTASQETVMPTINPEAVMSIMTDSQTSQEISQPLGCNMDLALDLLGQITSLKKALYDLRARAIADLKENYEQRRYVADKYLRGEISQATYDSLMDKFTKEATDIRARYYANANGIINMMQPLCDQYNVEAYKCGLIKSPADLMITPFVQDLPIRPPFEG
jgi:hypothetical protein